MIAAAGISAIGGLLSSRSARREQRKMRQELQRQREFAMQRWQHYLDTYGNLEQIMVGEAERGVVADIAGVSSRAAADTAMAFDGARDEDRRQMMGFGLDPSSGRYQSRDRQFGINQALAESFNVGTAREGERRWADEQTFGRRAHAWGIGRDIGESAARDVQGSTQAMAQMHGQSAAQYNNMANNLFTQAGFFGMYGAMDMAGGGSPPGGGGGNYMGTPMPAQNSGWNPQYAGAGGMQPAPAAIPPPQSGGFQPGGFQAANTNWGYNPTILY